MGKRVMGWVGKRRGRQMGKRISDAKYARVERHRGKRVAG